MVQGGGRTAEEIGALEGVVGMLGRTIGREDDVVIDAQVDAVDEDEMDQS